MIWDALYTLGIAVIIYVLLKYVMVLLDLKKYPPGPFPLPIIGNLHLLGKKPEQAFKRLSKKFGDVMSVSFGSQRVVVINSIHSGMVVVVRPVLSVINVLFCTNVSHL